MKREWSLFFICLLLRIFQFIRLSAVLTFYFFHSKLLKLYLPNIVSVWKDQLQLQVINKFKHILTEYFYGFIVYFKSLIHLEFIFIWEVFGDVVFFFFKGLHSYHRFIENLVFIPLGSKCSLSGNGHLYLSPSLNFPPDDTCPVFLGWWN